nr:IS3 family transposase [Cryobacterium sp. Hh38]
MRDVQGRQQPEILYGRRKMTAWLRRAGFADVSKHTFDRLMRLEGMNGLVRGRKPRASASTGKDSPQAPDLLKRNFSAPRPNHSWVTDFTYVPTWAASSTWHSQSTCTLVRSWAGMRQRSKTHRSLRSV